MKYLLYILVCFSVIGCRSVKSTKTESLVSKELQKSEIKSDSVSKIQTNGAIKDEIITSVPQANTDDAYINRLVNEQVAVILRSINTQKSSGGNSYRLEFDELNRKIKAYFELAETRNETNTTNKSDTTENSFEQKTDSYIEKKISQIPFWVYLLVGLWFLPQIMQRIMFITNPILGVVSKLKQNSKN